MRHEPLDPEVIAALLDGKLSAEEREATMKRLTDSPDDYEAFVAAASALRDLDADETAGPTQPPLLTVSPAVRETGRGRRFPGVRIWLPLAAVLAGVLLVPRLVLRDGAAGTPIGLLDGETLVRETGAGSLAAALGPAWDQPGWSVRRGGGESLPEARRDFRIGVRLADLEAAFDAGDPDAVQRVAPELTGLVEQLGIEGGDVISQYRQIGASATQGESGGDLEREHARAAKDLADLLRDSPWFGLGAWVEQARLATLAKRTEFFDGRPVRVLEGLIDRVVRQRGEDAPVVRQLRSLQGLLGDGASPVELERIEAELAAVIREGGG